MSAKKSFSALRAKTSPEARANSALKAEALRRDMNLSELRRARQLSQEALATILEVSQGSVAKMEKRTDIYISSLRRFVEAMGGELEVTAKFPDHSIRIKQFSELEEPAAV